MRIVDRKTFLTLPPGTAFQKGKPWYWEGLCFKTAAEYENDWRFLTIDEVSGDSEVGCCDLYDRMRDAGVSFPM